MVGPLDFLTDTKKDRLIDAALTRLANTAEGAGSNRLAESLRSLRNDTPFIEDVAAGLKRALIRFSREWRARDPEIVAVLEDSRFWESNDLLSELCAILIRPLATNDTEFQQLRIALNQASPEVEDWRIDEALARLISLVREELFSHPQLQGIHELYLQVESVNRQGAMLEELRTIHQDNTAVLKLIKSQLGQSERAMITGTPRGISGEVTTHGRVSSGLAGETLAGLPLPDVLTPSLNDSDLVRISYTPVVGHEAASWLQSIQSDITHSIEIADFSAQEAIARRLLENDFEMPKLAASGHYMLGEAQRLQADFVSNSAERGRLLNAAADSYSTALDLDPDSARSRRGLGRVYEVKGNIGNALKLYSRARLKALDEFESDELSNSEAAHEVLRSTRHYASCMSQRLAEDVQGPSARDSSIRQLHGIILGSEDLHRSILPKFAAQSDWMYIEWFMGLVLLAKSYSVAQDIQRAWFSLLYALSARMEMMDETALSLSAVERGNITWWCNTAKTVKLQNPSSRVGVERLAESVAKDDVRMVWVNMRDLVWPVQAPWSPQIGRKPA